MKTKRPKATQKLKMRKHEEYVSKLEMLSLPLLDFLLSWWAAAKTATPGNRYAMAGETTPPTRSKTDSIEVKKIETNRRAAWSTADSQKKASSDSCWYGRP